ncbi:polysaccharide deacetylase family protein [Cognatishimia sp. WU-CL00825]|uniref:polysaccharide deacetylase family protein n=1 Tax=Cognatishimia sp. WU-CL00825 TaxID=3127658 RepID=UPI003103DB20
MKLDWSPLQVELQRWRKDGLTLPVWWRDDDATDPSAALDRLINLSSEVSMPVHLAVIPRNATQALAKTIADTAQLHPVVHGWSHTNFQPSEGPKSEFGDARALDLRCEEAAEGLRRLTVLCGDQLVAMFVPPWNRVDLDLVEKLPALGYQSLSTSHPKTDALLVHGLRQINTHIDPLYWRPSKNLSDPQAIIEKAVRLLKKRRQGKSDNTEPFGLLTHHMAHFPEVWEFCRQFWMEFNDGPVEIFQHPKGQIGV